MGLHELIFTFIGSLLTLLVTHVFTKNRDKAKTSFESSAILQKRAIDGGQAVIETSTDIVKYIETEVIPQLDLSRNGKQLDSKKTKTYIKKLAKLVANYNDVVRLNRTYIYYLIPHEASSYYTNAISQVTTSLSLLSENQSEKDSEHSIELLVDGIKQIQRYHADLHSQIQSMHKYLNEGLPIYSSIRFDDMRP